MACNYRKQSGSALALCLLFVHCSFLQAQPASSTKGSYSHDNGRIVDGNELPIYNAPWQVSLQISARHTCGGSIYTQLIIITAAHCVANSSISLMKVRVGSNQQNTGGTLMPVAAYLVHEEYNAQRLRYDIALIRLEKSLSFSLSVKPINLATLSPANGDSAITTGWGYTERNGASGYPSVLQTVQLQIISQSICSTPKYGYGWDFVTEEMICAAAAGKDTCVGDSGGPLISNGLLVGVVSWGYGCALANYPGVYMDVASLRSWIIRAANTV